MPCRSPRRAPPQALAGPRSHPQMVPPGAVITDLGACSRSQLVYSGVDLYAREVYLESRGVASGPDLGYSPWFDVSGNRP